MSTTTSPATASSLSDDLFLLIADHLHFEDLISLSSVTKGLRELLGPKIFRGLRFLNDESSADFVKSLAEKYAKNLRYLHCVLRVDGSNVLQHHDGDSTRDLLQGSFLPGLDCIRIQTDIQVPLAESLTPSGETLTQVDRQRLSVGKVVTETREDVARIYTTLLMKPWLAAASNENFQSLEIDQLLPFGTEIFAKPAIGHLFGRLKKIRIAVAASVNTDERSAFLEDMGKYFFRHLISLEELDLSYPDEMDFEALLHADRAWDEDYLPRIKSLTVRKLFVGNGLVDLILSRLETLQTVHLDGCVCSPCRLDSWPSPFAGVWKTWHNVFTDIREADPKMLREVRVTPQDIFQADGGITYIGLDDFQLRYSAWDGPVGEYAADIPRMLEQNPHLIVFPYFFIEYDWRDQIVPAGHLGTVEAFRKGRDQREFDLLTEVVHRNARSAEESRRRSDLVVRSTTMREGVR